MLAWAACFIAGVGIPWLAWILWKGKWLPVTVFVDEDDPRPSDVARYLAEIAARLDAHPEKMRVVFVAPRKMTLDIEPDGRFAIRLPGRRTCRFELRRRWIADHPVPLDLGRPTVLYVNPVDANRFRVSDRRRVAVPLAMYAVLSLAATLAVVLVSPGLLLVVLGLTIGCATMSLVQPPDIMAGTILGGRN